MKFFFIEYLFIDNNIFWNIKKYIRKFNFSLSRNNNIYSFFLLQFF